MSRYIEEADFLIHLVKKPRYSSKTIGEAIDESHSIDIVHCGECKYEPICNTSLLFKADNGLDVVPIDFCSYGEREGE